MAKMMDRRERKIRKIIGKWARAALDFMDMKEAVTSPHTYLAKKVLEEASKADKVKMRRGPVRNREQFLNPRTGRYYVREKGGKILYGGKKSPYKNIRFAKRRKTRK